MKEVDSTDIDNIILNLKREWNEKSRNLSKISDRKIGTTNIYIMLPVDFEWMDREKAKINFFSKYRPELIFSNLEGDTCFTFRVLDETLEIIKEKSQSALEKEDGRTVFYDKGIVESEVGSVLWFDYKGFMGNEKIYNLMFFTSLEETIFMGTFSCFFEAYEEWKWVVLDLLKTIRL